MDQAAVARAAEEDVDAYIVKPFSFSAIKETIQSSVVSKVRPSQYMQCIEQAKIMMEHRKFEECLSTLKRALKMNAKPTLAYYYLGLLKTKLSKTQEAKDSYRSGLKYNKIHFKCQKGLYETYMKEKKYVQAYHVIQTLSEYFPPNAERLSTAIRLAVLTQNFTDISRYYMAFKTLERRSEEAIGHVCAGLFVLGKYFIQEHNKPKAIESFEKLCATCSGNPKFLIPVIQSLLENMMFDYVESFFLKIDRDVVSTDDYELCQFYSSVNKSRDQDIVKNGLSLINKGIRDFWLYRLSIDAMIKSRFKEQAFEFIHKGKKLWPMKSNAWARLEYFAKKIEDQAAVPSSTKAA